MVSVPSTPVEPSDASPNETDISELETAVEIADQKSDIAMNTADDAQQTAAETVAEIEEVKTWQQTMESQMSNLTVAVTQTSENLHSLMQAVEAMALAIASPELEAPETPTPQAILSEASSEGADAPEKTEEIAAPEQVVTPKPEVKRSEAKQKVQAKRSWI